MMISYFPLNDIILLKNLKITYFKEKFKKQFFTSETIRA